MGKGDKKTKKGKIVKGTFGVRRLKKGNKKAGSQPKSIKNKK
jgi:30S ribosomal protein S31